MALQPTSRPLAALAVVFLVVSSGCAGTQLGAREMTAEEIGEKVERKYENAGTFTGTVTTETITGNETRTTTAEVWMNRSANHVRYEYAAPESRAGTVLVSNGSTMWMYNDTTNTVRKTNISGLTPQGTTNYGKVVGNLLDNYDVTYRGTETVGGRSTYVLSLAPKNGSGTAELTQNYTLWIDKESWFPVKRHTVISLDDRTVETVMTYTDLTLDANVPPGTFEFDPPEDAEVVESDIPEAEQYGSVGAAEANVSFDVTAPRYVPGGYELGNVTVTSGDDYTTASLAYRNDTSYLSVTQSTRTAAAGGTNDAETVEIDGQNGTYQEFGSTGIVQWTCGGESYTVTGSLPKSELLAVAESIDCE